IDAVQLHDLPEGARIVPGMPVTADIRVGKRTIIGYLMSRFIPAASEGMREP
ncbi:HlyD family type I secretion periplasmic adaptor subunit, partial [Rhodovastum atsumiense]